MIILKHLTVERFRLLWELNLHFPQRGSILIQGPNEAGKSALLESIYFALYGEPLTPGRGLRSLDELILYGAGNAIVTLTLSIGATELAVTRVIERGQGQKVSLQVRRLGLPAEEPITNVQAANARIIAEMGGIDGTSLRNSCLVEQKGLARLEHISGAEREATVRKLLGLEQVRSLSNRFFVQPGDEQRLQEASQYLRLAELQHRIPEVSKRLEEIEIALDAITVHEQLEDIKLQEADIAEQEQALKEVEQHRLELRDRQHRSQQLKKADAVLSEIITSYDEISEAQREIPELERQIADLELREREELPELQARVNELSDLSQSFGTLQRMSNDLLSSVDSVKELEQEYKQYEQAQNELRDLSEQVTQARNRLTQAQQALVDLEERHRTERPNLEQRLESMRFLKERLGELRRLEEQYNRRLAGRSQAEENRAQLDKLRSELDEAEQKLSLVEAEAGQVQQRADIVEQHWRQANIRHLLEDWYRLMGLQQGLTQAEQRLNQARQQYAEHDRSFLKARQKMQRITITALAAAVACIVFIVLAFVLFSGQLAITALFILLAVLAAAVAVLNFHNSKKAREAVALADKQRQDASHQVSMMVSARESAMRMAGDRGALEQVQQQIRSFGGNIPRSLDEARHIMDQEPDQPEVLAELQQQVKERHDEVDAARQRVNAAQEVVTRLRNEQTSLEEHRRQEDWDNVEENLRNDQAAIERMHQEITLLAGQEGLPVPSIMARLRSGVPFEMYASGQMVAINPEETTDAGVPDLEELVSSTVKAVEQEIATLDNGKNQVPDLENQVKAAQDTLNAALERQQGAQKRFNRFLLNNPAQRMEQAREQQTALSQALQSLRNSLHQRVQPLGVAFGQAAITNAETAARKQLEDLQITLGSRIMLQEKHKEYVNCLKTRQDALPDLYKQLAKYSNTLGSWIVPPNPFTEALIALRERCKEELKAINEEGIAKEEKSLQAREGAAKAKMALCRQEIEEAQERIAVMLVQRGRPTAKSYTLSALAAVWPLLNQYTLEDRARLTSELADREKELSELEEQEMKLSKQMHIDQGSPIDLEQARARQQECERAYLVKKHGTRLLAAANERLLHKVGPRTEFYVQQLLPALTSARYHDVHLITEDEQGAEGRGPFQLEVWDTAAGAYVPKSALSGGAADQLSLALRLAFAIATLPRDLNIAPGFVILDEPLSSFDRGRAQALVDVVTGELLGQHFEQILLISHSSAFEPAMFPYHLYMENGLITESNLPVVPETPVPAEMERAVEGQSEATGVAGEEDEMVTMRVPAVTTFPKKNKQ